MSANIQPPPLPPEDHWYYVENRIQEGPVTAGALRALLSDNIIDAETQVWRTGWREWKPIRETELATGEDAPPKRKDALLIADAQADQMDEEYELHDADAPPTTERMIDWTQCCKLPVTFSVIGLFILNYVFQQFAIEKKPLSTFFPTTGPDLFVLLLAVTYVMVGPVALISQLLGVTFNAAKDTLSYPLYVFRRKIRLSEIRDANSQTITKPAFQITNTIIGMVSVGQIKGLGTTKRYFANMSGDFGSRRIVFHTKSKRDQFFSLLRRYAPQCRITRWYRAESLPPYLENGNVHLRIKFIGAPR
ncbi:DUF4339 domain-containing protein [Bradyrhizobium sp. 26S5]|uniref:DUF4339 domain-containing protein n=1 Tax=Bradyrhizobium sp. 26S5 TaxID=3139729 RepID=UPI0030CFD60A